VVHRLWRPGSCRTRLLGALCALAVSAAGCRAGTPARTTTTTEPNFSVGVDTETLVDPSRPTPPNGSVPGHQDRILMVSVFYPSTRSSPEQDAPPNQSAAPYPLIVFAHGFGSNPAAYQQLLVAWASTGYVVAAPTFPLTNADAPGGPDLADYINQPGDLSFVVSQLEAQSQQSLALLSGMVDSSEVAAAGHSLGGVTTLGLVGNTCCLDSRIKAAVVMAGDQLTFPDGQTKVPSIPILFIHGNADETVPYISSVLAFNADKAPKALLTIDGGDHESPVSGRAFATVVRTTTAFFDLYLKHKGSAAQLQADGNTGRTHLAFASRVGEKMALPVPKSLNRKLRATVVPSSGLADGEEVQVSWQGYKPGITVNVLECSLPLSGAQDCDLNRADIGVADPTGSGSVGFPVHTGPIGTGVCDAASPKCVLAVNQGGSSNPSDTAVLPISFSG